MRDVRVREDGSLLVTVNATVTISANAARPHVSPQWLECYRLAPDGTLDYLGGEPLGWPSPDGKAHFHYAGKPAP
jgi:hypothetical protein